MNESFSAVVSLRELQTALSTFEIDGGAIDRDIIIEVDDHSTLTIAPPPVETITIQGK